VHEVNAAKRIERPMNFGGIVQPFTRSHDHYAAIVESVGVFAEPANVVLPNLSTCRQRAAVIEEVSNHEAILPGCGLGLPTPT
jgi:hypothetical protein